MLARSLARCLSAPHDRRHHCHHPNAAPPMMISYRDSPTGSRSLILSRRCAALLAWVLISFLSSEIAIAPTEKHRGAETESSASASSALPSAAAGAEHAAVIEAHYVEGGHAVFIALMTVPCPGERTRRVLRFILLLPAPRSLDRSPPHHLMLRAGMILMIWLLHI